MMKSAFKTAMRIPMVLGHVSESDPQLPAQSGHHGPRLEMRLDIQVETWLHSAVTSVI
jgi:hypothetical protein